MEQSFDYYASGAHDEVTLRANRAAFERPAIAYRVLVDVSRRDPRDHRVLGMPVAMPMPVAPTAFHCSATEGEVATARRRLRRR